MLVILFCTLLSTCCASSAVLKINDHCFQWDSSHICPDKPHAALLRRKHLFRGLSICRSQISESRQTNRDIWLWRCREGPQCVLTFIQLTLISQNPSHLNEPGLGNMAWAHITHTITYTFNICARCGLWDKPQDTCMQKTERDTARLQMTHPVSLWSFCLFQLQTLCLLVSILCNFVVVFVVV